MNMVDVVILLLLGLGAVIGFKKGFFRNLIEFVGLIVILVLSFYLKNPISEFLCLNFPFFDFSGAFKGVAILNILIYELIAFSIIFGILNIALQILIKITKIFETILKFTIVFGIPSKIGGAIVGFIQYYIYIFIGLVILMQPTFDIEMVNNSKVANKIIKNTPILSNSISSVTDAVEEILELKESYESATSNKTFNDEAIKILLDKNIVKKSTVVKLLEKGKLDLEDMSILEDYE